MSASDLTERERRVLEAVIHSYVETAEPADPFYGFMVEHIATKAIDRIGGIDDDASFLQFFRNLADLSAFGIIRIDPEQHGFRFKL